MGSEHTMDISAYSRSYSGLCVPHQKSTHDPEESLKYIGENVDEGILIVRTYCTIRFIQIFRC